MDALLDRAPCGFATFGDDGVLRLVNTTLAALLGYGSGEELAGRRMEEILSPGGRVFYHTHFLPMLKLHGRAEEIYLTLRHRDGRQFPVLANGAHESQDGVGVNHCVFLRIHQRARFEEELLLAKRAAERASAAKAKFLSMMSHDLRTPLQAISGYAQFLLLEAHGPLTPEQREDVNAIIQAAREMVTLVDDILGFAQLESGRVQVRIAAVPLAGALARAEALTRTRFAEAGLAYERQGCPDDVVASADPDRLQQILLNLLTNAAKFTPAGGRICTRCRREGSRAVIDVEDTGRGIPHDQIGRIFEAFVQVEPQDGSASRSGVGLGLAISRELARAMHGDLSVVSTPGQGSTFTVTLPARDGDTDGHVVGPPA